MHLNQIKISFTVSRATLSLVLLSALCCALLIIRAIQTEQIRGLFLLWNLFLAWVPLFFSLTARRFSLSTAKTSKFTRILIYTSLAFWLLFFPNAPYIITDLIHLGEYNSKILWFDTVGFFIAALAGISTGLYSLYVAHHTLNKLTSRLLAWIIVSTSVVLSGFGLYLGRFVRFNSWDLFTQPFFLLRQSLHELRNPLAIQTTLVFTLVVMVLYVAILILIPNRHASFKDVA